MAGVKIPQTFDLAGLFTTLVGTLTSQDIASHCKEFASYVELNLDGVLANFEQFDISISSQVSELKEVQERLQESVKAAYKFVGSVDDFFYYGKITNYESIKNELKKAIAKN